MPIVKTIQGDLVAAFLDKNNKEITDMAHGCNCVGSMGAGIAATVATLIPEACVNDRMYTKGRPPLLSLGTFSYAHVAKAIREGQANATCFNLYTQAYPGRGFPDKNDIPCDYKAIRRCFEVMNTISQMRGKGMRLGIPLIGCGLARGDWNIVEDIINKATPDLEVVLYKFVPKAPPKFIG